MCWGSESDGRASLKLWNVLAFEVVSDAGLG